MQGRPRATDPRPAGRGRQGPDRGPQHAGDDTLVRRLSAPGSRVVRADAATAEVPALLLLLRRRTVRADAGAAVDVLPVRLSRAGQWPRVARQATRWKRDRLRAARQLPGERGELRRRAATARPATADRLAGAAPPRPAPRIRCTPSSFAARPRSTISGPANKPNGRPTSCSAIRPRSAVFIRNCCGGESRRFKVPTCCGSSVASFPPTAA